MSAEINLDFDLDKIKPCKYVFCMPIVAHNGDVTVCCNDNFFELKIGNINEQSLETIWTNEKATHLRLQHVLGQLEDTPNKKCYFCRKHWKIPEMEDEWVVDYLKSINRSELIEQFLSHSFHAPLARHETETELVIFYKTREPASGTPSFFYVNEDNFNKGYKFIALVAPCELKYGLKIPEFATSMSVTLHLAGINGPVTARVELGQISWEIEIKPINSGEGERYEFRLSNDDFLTLKKRVAVTLSISAVNGTLGILEEPIEKNLPRTPIKIVFNK